jgi:hypothetical protein
MKKPPAQGSTGAWAYQGKIATTADHRAISCNLWATSQRKERDRSQRPLVITGIDAHAIHPSSRALATAA